MNAGGPPSYSTHHVPVMLDQVIQWLEPRPGQTIVDATLGGGGHAAELARHVAPAGRVIGLDRDPGAVSRAAERLAGTATVPIHARYSDLPAVLARLGIDRVDAILMDLGLSSDQLADQERGFSFRSGGPLDLRFDPGAGEPAWRLLERLDERSLADLIYQFGEERFSRRIARAIVERRGRDPVRTADELAEVVHRAIPRSARQHRPRIDPATRTFQALRIAVNDELGELERALASFPELLVPGGRLAVISFHSLEDRLVKQAFRDDPRWESLTRKPVRPNASEVAMNPRARSARLRVAAR